MTDLQFLLTAHGFALTVAAGYRAGAAAAIRWHSRRTIRRLEQYLRHPANQPGRETP